MKKSRNWKMRRNITAYGFHYFLIVTFSFIVFMLFLASYLSLTAAQFSKFVPPSPTGYTICQLGNGFNQSYCPNTTYCVDPVRAANLWFPGMTALQTVLSEFSSPGCCPFNTNPCFSPLLPWNVPGCCGVNKTCCFSKFNPTKFLGCVDERAQCCGDTICPVGYSCCQQDTFSLYYCCPGTNACSFGIDLNASIAANATIISRIPNIYFSGGKPLILPKPYSTCLMPALINNFTVYQPWPDNMTIPCGTQGSLCLNATEDCIARNGFNLSLDPNSDLTIFQENGMFCCKKNTTICPMSVPKNHQTIIGCADESLGESCCASQICPRDFKCCHYFPPQDNTFAFNTLFSFSGFSNSSVPTPNPINETAVIFPSTDICCPVGTFCCASLVNLDNSLDPAKRRIWGYCGRDENCLSIATMSESILPLPQFGGFVPDYIEQPEGTDTSEFWMAPIDRFSNGVNNICGNCNAFSPGISNCHTCMLSDCQDQCQLDVTVQC